MGMSKAMEADAEMICLIQKMHEFEIDALPSKEALAVKYELSDTFYKRMERMIRVESKRKTWVKKAHGFVAAIAVILMLGFVSNFDAVAQAAESFFKWMETVITFEFGQSSDTSDADEVREYTLGYVPEGYFVTDDIDDNMGNRVIQYGKNNSANVISFYYSVSNISISINNEYADYEERKLENGDVVYILDSYNTDYYSSVVWQNESKSMVFTLSGSETVEELLKIRENIQ